MASRHVISVGQLLDHFPSAGGLSIHWKNLHLASGFPLAPAGRAQTKNRLVLLGPSFLTVLITVGSWCTVHSGGRMGPLNRDFHSPANSPRAAPVGGKGAWLLLVTQVCLATGSSPLLALLLRPLPTHAALSTQQGLDWAAKNCFSVFCWPANSGKWLLHSEGRLGAARGTKDSSTYTGQWSEPVTSGCMPLLTSRAVSLLSVAT